MFDVRKHLIKVQGGKDYLPVAARLIWFREEKPEWAIETEALLLDTEKGMAIFRAIVRDSEGRAIATATKAETVKGFPDFIEKAETGAVGRALALCGYGTQFAPELEEGDRIVDSPQPTGEPSYSTVSAKDKAEIERRERLIGIVKHGWQKRQEQEPAFAYWTVRRNSIKHAAKQNIISQPDIAINDAGKWVTAWLNTASLEDLQNYINYLAAIVKQGKPEPKTEITEEDE